MSTLFVVGTPIGNLEDITLRALRVLREVRLIAAEDTRRTRLLLSRHGIATAVTSYHEHNKLSKLSQILSVLQDGMDVALVSDAGMPGISDPGFELVSAVIARGIPVVPVPGPSALISALAVSGLPTDQFVYLGYLPRQARKREGFLKSVAHEKRTLVAFEAPHRLESSLQAMRDAWGNRRIVVARELTKVYEEIRRSTISEEVAHFATTRAPGRVHASDRRGQGGGRGDPHRAGTLGAPGPPAGLGAGPQVGRRPGSPGIGSIQERRIPGLVKPEREAPGEAAARRLEFFTGL